MPRFDACRLNGGIDRGRCTVVVHFAEVLTPNMLISRFFCRIFLLENKFPEGVSSVLETFYGVVHTVKVKWAR